MSRISVLAGFVLTWVFFALLTGCSDDDPVKPDSETYAGLTGVVVDTSGQPLSGVAIGIVYELTGKVSQNQSPAFMIRPSDKPATQLQFVVPETGVVQALIFDYAGDLVVTLVAGVLQAGRHSVIWQAQDDDGERVPTGLYYFYVQLGDRTPIVADIFLFDDEPVSFLAAPNALADEEGRFQIPDSLIPVGETLIGTDETGQVVGEVTVSATMQIVAIHEPDGIPLWSTITIDHVPGGGNGLLQLVLPD